MRSELLDKNIIRKSGYDNTHEKLNNFMTFHNQKSEELKKLKTQGGTVE